MANGKESAWRTLYESHYPFMCYLASQYLHDDYLAEVIANDVITHLWEIRKSVFISKSLRSYLLESTRNRCIDYLKSSYGKLMKNASFQDDISNLVFDGKHPLGTLLERELEAQLSQALEKIPQQTRLVFNMSRNEEMTYEEIASMLGISVNTVKYHIKKALAILRDELGEYLGIALLFLAIL